MKIYVDTIMTDNTFCAKPSYKSNFSADIYSNVLTPIECLLDIRTGFSHINKDHPNEE